MKTLGRSFRKILLIAWGVIFFLTILEIGLRVGGWTLEWLQGQSNRAAIRQKGTYRILCLGESTTQKQYPQLLEKILGQRQSAVRFTVFDEAKAGTNTTAILNHIETYLDQYRPDAVTAMMGINDQGVRYYRDLPDNQSWFFKHCHAYRFIQILFHSVSDRFRNKNAQHFDSSERSAAPKAVLPSATTGTSADATPEKLPQGQGPNEASPSDKLHEFLRTARTYRVQGRFSLAEETLTKALAFDPRNDEVYAERGWVLKEQGQLLQAERSFWMALTLNPGNDTAYAGLAWLRRDRGQSRESIQFFKKAVDADPYNEKNWAELGRMYRNQGKFALADASFRKAIAANPHYLFSFLELASLYREQGEFLKAETLFKEALKANPHADRIYRAMSSLYAEQGKSLPRTTLAVGPSTFSDDNYPTITVDNYRKLKKILDRRAIRLICVQYPMRNVLTLKKIFENDKTVLFVDNGRSFKEALQHASYMEYFRDMFAGDFGHCTTRGNKLIAQNIADVILREIFEQR